jgi:hypothetical protein
MVAPVRSVRNLGVFINSDLVMRTNVVQVVSRCFAMRRQLLQVRRYLLVTTIQTLVVALLLRRLYYANSPLDGSPTYLVRHLRSVLNASARLIYGLGQHAHITDALISLHWLRVPERVKFKLAVLTHRVLHGAGPVYLGPLCRESDLPGRRSLRSAFTNQLVTPTY